MFYRPYSFPFQCSILFKYKACCIAFNCATKITFSFGLAWNFTLLRVWVYMHVNTWHHVGIVALLKFALHNLYFILQNRNGVRFQHGCVLHNAPTEIGILSCCDDPIKRSCRSIVRACVLSPWSVDLPPLHWRVSLPGQAGLKGWADTPLSPHPSFCLLGGGWEEDVFCWGGGSPLKFSWSGSEMEEWVDGGVGV